MNAEGNIALAEEFHEPLADVLSRVEGVLAEIARLVDHNQSLIARLTWTAGAADPSYVAAMQEADLVSQKLDGIAGFLRAIAKTLPADFRVETHRATGDLLLAELTRKIGARGREEPDAAGEGPGEFELF
ncbi:MAG TPA: hypothetical protein VNS34_21050 [Rhizobiaceae bacterium]|nr:hypothetical protein [Rhizobiaceae bacterium]